MGPQSSDPPEDGSDDLFDYNVNIQEIFRDVDITMDAPGPKPAAVSKSKNDSIGLGIDEEIKVTKKRQPVPKLDENRLLSQAGIPKLRRLTKERFKFRGKGHEYSDLATLLNVYQLWLDDLYPRAKFADGLAIIEKLGHSKRMQIMRREWINEGKPRGRYGDLDFPQEDRLSTRASGEPKSVDDLIGHGRTADNSGRRRSSVPEDDDLYTASPRREQQQVDQQPLIEPLSGNAFQGSENDNGVPEDDLDNLLAETSHESYERFTTDLNALSRQNYTSPRKGENFDAEMEAMAETDEMW
ncbi:MAG: hypothetical protein Q9170_003962 [Blastenia crenularia]